jgi:DNA-binding transcriptional MocR family regulator
MTTDPKGTTLDPWRDEYAVRTAGLSASEVRALFAVASRPEVVSLAGGMPAVSALPLEHISETMQRVMRDRGPQSLQYGSGQGTPEIRERIMEICALEGIEGSANNVVVTTGSQQALDLITKLFIDAGDVVFVESPSYLGALGIFRSYQATTVHVETDADGMIPEALEESIQTAITAGQRMKFLYVIPNFNNPSGVTLAESRRAQLIEIAKRHHILIIEDNPYGLLWFDRPAPPAMRSIEEDGIVYLGSFSKTFAPGFRVGWALAPHAIREKLVLASESAILCPSSMSQNIISDYLERSDWKGQIDTFRGLYRDRRDAMLGALDEFLPGFQRTEPNGGFYVWLTLPEFLDSKAMLPRAVSELVAYTPGTAFYSNGLGRDRIRLAFCYPTPETIHEGIRRLGEVIRQETELVETFNPPIRANDPASHVSSPPPDLT